VLPKVAAHFTHQTRPIVLGHDVILSRSWNSSRLVGKRSIDTAIGIGKIGEEWSRVLILAESQRMECWLRNT